MVRRSGEQSFVAAVDVLFELDPGFEMTEITKEWTRSERVLRRS